MKFCERWFTDFNNYPNKTPISDPVRHHATVPFWHLYLPQQKCLPSPQKEEFSSPALDSAYKAKHGHVLVVTSQLLTVATKTLAGKWDNTSSYLARTPECEFRTLQIDICKMNLIYTQSQIQTHLITRYLRTKWVAHLTIYVKSRAVLLFSTISRRASWYL